MSDTKFAELAVEVWKKVVDVQQHFNEIEMKIRNLAVTLLVGVSGAAAFALDKRLTVSLFGRDIPVAVAVLMAGALGWVAFFLMEYFWYHVFLKAAGKQAGAIEKAWGDFLPEMRLSTVISESSKVKVLGIETTSSQRLFWFYSLGFLIFLILCAGAFAAHRPADPPSPAIASPLSPSPQIVVIQAPGPALAPETAPTALTPQEMRAIAADLAAVAARLSEVAARLSAQPTTMQPAPAATRQP